jgi:tetratricopeptide (TPR) repeat protein
MAKRNRPTKRELEEDQFVEWMVHASDYVKERGRIFAAGAAAVVIIILAVNYVQASRVNARTEAATLLGEVLMAEQGGQQEEAIRLGEQLLSQYSGTTASAHGTILLGNRYFNQGRYAEAEKLYQAYLTERGDIDVLVFAAWRGMAACYEAQDQYDKAAAKYAEYASTHADNMAASLALMDAARCYGAMGDTQRQQDLLKQVTREFASSPVSVRARQELELL